MSRRARALSAGALAAALLAVAPSPGAEELSMRRAIDLALAKAPEVRAALAARAEAAAGVRAARSARSPGLSARSGPGYASGVPAPVLGELPAAVSVELHQTLFDAGALASEARARAEAASAEGELAEARVTVARAAAEAFARCLRDASVLTAVEGRWQETARARERAEARLKEGRTTELERERARLEEARARELAADWRSRADLDRLTLADLIGVKGDDLPPLSAELAADLGEPSSSDDLDRAVASDPQLAGLTRAALQLERASAWRQRWFQPSIQAEARYSRLYKTADWDVYYSRFQAGSWSVGASIVWSLYTGGRLGAEAARARAAADRASARRATRQRELALAVAEARSGLERARAHVSLAALAKSVAQRALRDALALAAEGRLDPSEQMRRQVDLLSAEQESAEARYELLSKRIALLALRGELLPSD